MYCIDMMVDRDLLLDNRNQIVNIKAKKDRTKDRSLKNAMNDLLGRTVCTICLKTLFLLSKIRIEKNQGNLTETK